MNNSFLYKVLSSFFYKERPYRNVNRLDKILVSLVDIQFLFQNLTFLWSPVVPIAHWESYLKFWILISYPSIDVIAAALKSSFILLLISLSSLTIILLLLMLHIFLGIYEKKTPNFLIKLSGILIYMVCDIYFIPSTILLVLLFKYSTINLSYIEEYDNYPSSASLQLGVMGQTISSIYLILNLSISLVNECCKYEIRHSLTDKSVEAKSFSYLGVYVKIIHFISCICVCTIQKEFYFYFLVAFGLTHGFIWYFYITRLIYYLNFINFVKATLHFDIFFISVFFVTGYLIDNSSVIIVLTVFMQPFIIITSRLLVLYRLSKIKPLKKKIESKFYSFEISARQRLLSSENPKQLLKYTNINYSKTQKDILFVIQAYYCADILNNSALASIKLSRANSKSMSFFSGFQVYKCYKVLEENNLKVSEGFKLCFYLLSIDRILNQEKKLCKNFLRFWNKIIDRKCEFSSLNKFLNKSVRLMGDIRGNYEENLARHPSSQQINEMYGTILIEMLGEPELGQTHLEISRSRIKKKNAGKKQLFSDKDTCIMIISGDTDTLGNVVYMSLSMGILLGISAEDSKDYTLNDFIPKPYNHYHNINLSSYVEHGLTQYIFHNIEICLKDTDGFLLECAINIECVGYELTVNFIVFVEPIKKWNAAVALINDTGFIYSHSKDFPKSIGQNKYKLETSNLSEFFSKETLDACEPGKFLFSKIYSFDTRSYIDICIYSQALNSVSEILHLYHFIYDTSELKILKNMKKNECIEINPESKNFLVKELDNFNFKAEKTTNRLNNENYSIEESKDIEVENLELGLDIKISEIDSKNAIKHSLINNQNQPNKTIFQDNNSPKKSSLLGFEETAIIKSASNSSTSYMTLLIRKEFNQAEKSLKFLKIIGFFSIIAIMFSNIMLLGYIVPQTTTFNPLQALSNLQSLNNYFSELAFLTIESERARISNENYIIPLEAYSGLISSLKIYNTYLMDDYATWSYCPSSNIVKKKIIPTWKSNDPSSIVYENLVDVVQLTLTNVIPSQAESFYEQISSNGSSTASYSFYIYFNTLPISTNQLQDAIDTLKACETTRIDQLSTIVEYLMIAGFCVLGVSFATIVWYLLKVDKKINLCWNRLLKKVQDNYSMLKRITIDRLANYHNIYSLEEEDDVNQRSKTSKLNFNSFRTYLMKFSILFIFSIVLYLVAVLVFYSNIQNYLHYRINLISITENRRTKVIQLSYFAMQQEAFFYSFDTASVYNYTLSPGILESFKRTDKVLAELRKGMESPLIYSYMPDQVWNLLYSNINQYSDFLKYGALFAIDYYRYESMCMVNYSCRHSDFNIKVYFNELNELIQALTNISNITNTLSQSQIEKELNSLIYFSAFSLLFFVFLYLFYYLPYLTQQQKMIKKIELMIKITPES